MNPEQLRRVLPTFLEYDPGVYDPGGPRAEKRTFSGGRLSKYLAIAVGGALGSLMRFWVGSVVASRLGTRFWYGTLIINVSACFIIGLTLTYLGRRTELSPVWRYLIPIGFVGAYSTFSTFEWEIFSGLEMGAVLLSSVYLIASILLGMIGVWAGVAMGNAIS
jgi:CrcB protein